MKPQDRKQRSQFEAKTNQCARRRRNLMSFGIKTKTLGTLRRIPIQNLEILQSRCNALSNPRKPLQRAQRKNKKKTSRGERERDMREKQRA